ncbi:hypothetical protein NE237_016021 [Protea cynaroides]|uniref:Uncharacterized protein n=1 Tax=Protea cynaroides TaxID=273540 RepID=A0A9Q0KF77_9MAGN|nr:hypothetical protein NE237_016021 [Protea cynaroides]
MALEGVVLPVRGDISSGRRENLSDTMREQTSLCVPLLQRESSGNVNEQSGVQSLSAMTEAYSRNQIGRGEQVAAPNAESSNVVQVEQVAAHNVATTSGDQIKQVAASVINQAINSAQPMHAAGNRSTAATSNDINSTIHGSGNGRISSSDLKAAVISFNEVEQVDKMLEGSKEPFNIVRPTRAKMKKQLAEKGGKDKSVSK